MMFVFHSTPQMRSEFLSPEALHYALQAVLASGGVRESFVVYQDGGGAVRLGLDGARRLGDDWAALDEWLPRSGDPLPLLHAGQTVGLLWTAPGEVLAAPAAGALAALLARTGAAPDPWSADQLSGHSALLDRCGRLRAATPGWLALYGLSGDAVGRPLGELRAEWHALDQALPDVLAGRARTLPAWWAAPDGGGGAPERLTGDLRPWPVAGSELAVLFNVWRAESAASASGRPGAAPPGAAPGAGLDDALLRAAFEQAAQAQWLVTGKGTVLGVNAAAAALGAGGAAAMLGEPIWSADVWRGHEGVRRQVRSAVLRAGRGEAAGALLELDAGPPWRLQARPLTEGHALLELSPLSHEPQDLDRRLALLEVILAHSCEGVVVADARGQIVLLGQAIRRMMNAGSQDAQPRDWARHVELRAAGGETAAALDAAQRPLLRTLRGEEVRDEEITVVSAQSARPALINTYRLGDGLGAVALVQDLSEKRRLLRHLGQVTRRDPLTEMPNRQAFADAVETALEQEQGRPGPGAGGQGQGQHAALLCELGGFAGWAARSGPTLSHRLWLDCAARFRSVFRGSDFVARFEQGQFAALLVRPGGAAGLGRVLERLGESFSVPFVVGEDAFVPELRVGVVPDLGAHPSAQAVLAEAWQALRPLPAPGLADE